MLSCLLKMGTNMSENKLSDRLIEWAQNNEMIDRWYTDHGKDCLEAAKLINDLKEILREQTIEFMLVEEKLRVFQKANFISEWEV